MNPRAAELKTVRLSCLTLLRQLLGQSALSQRERAARQVVLLRRLAEGTTYEHEARTAIYQANRLIVRYGLEGEI